MALVAAAGLVLASSSSCLANDAQADDAQAGTDMWRRTAHGWERIDQMRDQLAHYRTPDDFFITEELTRPPAPRWDFHPAWLVVLQTMAISAALGRLRASSKRASVNSSGGSSSLRDLQPPARAA
jgi:hypothetical protein